MSPLAPRFSEAEIRRYSRQILLPTVGGHGQARLRAAEVAVEIDTAAGRIAALALAAAGVGRLVLCGAVDRPIVDADVGFPFTGDDRGRALGEAVRVHLAARNPDLTVALAAGRPAGCLCVDDDGPTSLARAFARGGAAASALILALATGAAP